MQNWKRVIGATSVCLVMLSGTPVALADEPEVRPIFVISPISAEIPMLISAPISTSITGPVTYVDLEGGFYSVDDYRLIGDNELFKSFLDQQVQVTGTISEEPSTQMVKAIKVDEIILLAATGQPASDLQMVQANRIKPTSITFDGATIHFSQDPVVVNGTLLIPLRDLVKAAGGRVDWSGKTKSATVEMSDRMAYFVVGEAKAEMNQNGYRYFQRNLIAMNQAPQNIHGRLYVSADALSTILGLLEVDGQSDTMQLKVPSAPSVSKKPADCWGAFSGTVKDFGTKEAPAILVEGAPMADGEPNLVWALINPETIIVFAPAPGVAGEQPATIADLAVGQHVVVDMGGPMMMSYPGRVAAAKIVIER